MRDSQDDIDELQTYLELKRQMREDADARLKTAGVSWSKFLDWEQRMPSYMPIEPIQIGKYVAKVETTQSHIIPSNAPLGPTKQRVVLHEERK